MNRITKQMLWGGDGVNNALMDAKAAIDALEQRVTALETPESGNAELVDAIRGLTARLKGQETIAYLRRTLDEQKRYNARLKLEVDRLKILLQDAGVDDAPDWAKGDDDGAMR